MASCVVVIDFVVVVAVTVVVNTHKQWPRLDNGTANRLSEMYAFLLLS